MRRPSIMVLGIACLVAPATAQKLKSPQKAPTSSTSTTTPLRGTPSNPRSIAQPAAKTATLTVSYPAIQGATMTLTSPAGAFNCAAPSIGMPMVMCRLSAAAGATVAVQARWTQPSPIASNGVRIAGQQWGGACAGTPGDTCTLALAIDQTVAINPSAPGGIPVPMGTTAD